MSFEIWLPIRNDVRARLLTRTSMWSPCLPSGHYVYGNRRASGAGAKLEPGHFR
ncbi:MAG: hypothetical protein CM15mP125_0540 [Gammaproteobacteria bacterium]|nr:MAG: hypothetical protein CM15mP125_0540 [Gammaproteobacteria bacterium]